MTVKVRTNTRMTRFADGLFMGTGAAVNIELGWVPNVFELYNLTDGDRIDFSPVGTIMPFTSGGTTEVTEGSYVQGATSGAKARVNQVILASGTWAGGDAAGWFVLSAASISGTFTSENVFIYDGVNAVAGATNDATVTAAVTYELKTDTAVAAVSSNKIVRYAGVAGSAALGVTVGSDASESAKLFYFRAYGE